MTQKKIIPEKINNLKKAILINNNPPSHVYSLAPHTLEIGNHTEIRKMQISVFDLNK